MNSGRYVVDLEEVAGEEESPMDMFLRLAQDEELQDLGFEATALGGGCVEIRVDDILIATICPGD